MVTFTSVKYCVVGGDFTKGRQNDQKRKKFAGLCAQYVDMKTADIFPCVSQNSARSLKTDYLHFYMPNMGLKTLKNNLFKSTNARKEGFNMKLTMC